MAAATWRHALQRTSKGGIVVGCFSGAMSTCQSARGGAIVCAWFFILRFVLN
jgi:hypothetical protein